LPKLFSTIELEDELVHRNVNGWIFTFYFPVKKPVAQVVIVSQSSQEVLFVCLRYSVQSHTFRLFFRLLLVYIICRNKKKSFPISSVNSPGEIFHIFLVFVSNKRKWIIISCWFYLFLIGNDNKLLSILSY
jgi:hypothetical protein